MTSQYTPPQARRSTRTPGARTYSVQRRVNKQWIVIAVAAAVILLLGVGIGVALGVGKQNSPIPDVVPNQQASAETVETSGDVDNQEEPEPVPTDDVALGAQWVTGYWHNFNNGSTQLTLSEVPSEYNLIAVAFAEADPNTIGGITFHVESAELNGYSDAQFREDITAIQGEGRKVILSVGGEKATVSVNDAASAKNFATSALAVLKDYGFDGIDIDLEHGIHAASLARALREIQGEFGDDLIITMAPQTIDFQGPEQQYYKLAEEIKDILTVVNMQYYNSGSMQGCDGAVYNQGTIEFLAAQACIQLEMGLRADQVGIGVPAVPSAAGSGYMSVTDVVKAVDCLQEGTACGSFRPPRAYGRLGGVMTWSINWDATNDYRFARGASSFLNGTDPGPVNTDDPLPTVTEAEPESTDVDGLSPLGEQNQNAACMPWANGTVYTSGDVVTYDGATYTAKWWTNSDTPSSNPDGPWRSGGDC